MQNIKERANNIVQVVLYGREAPVQLILVPYIQFKGATARQKKWKDIGFACLTISLIILFSILHRMTPQLDGATLERIECTSAFVNPKCGFMAERCLPIPTDTTFFCPSGCSSIRNPSFFYVGESAKSAAKIVIGSESGYRADSWICQAGIHQGVIDDSGGIISVKVLPNSNTTYIGSERNGISSMSFNATYLASFTTSIPLSTCYYCFSKEIPAAIGLALYQIALPFVLRKKQLYFYGVMISMFVFYSLFSSDTGRSNLINYLERILPYFAFIYIFYIFFADYILPNISEFPFELIILFTGGLWFGLYIDLLSNYLPVIPSLSFSQKMLKNGVGPFLIVIGATLLTLIIAGYFLWQHRNQHTLLPILQFYAISIPVYVLIPAILGNLVLHVHHYIIALYLLPATRLRTRFSLFMFAILVGWFSQGAIKYGFDSPFITVTQQANEAGLTLGSTSTDWRINSTLLRDGVVSWTYPFNSTLNLTDLAIGNLKTQLTEIDFNAFAVTSYSLVLNDVEVYRGKSASFTIDKALAGPLYYLRVAPVVYGSTLDFSNILQVDLQSGNFKEFPKYSK